METLGGFQTQSGTNYPTHEHAGVPVNGVDEVQRLTSTATGGTFKITFTNPLSGLARQTLAIAWNATVAAIIAALEALDNFPVGGAVGSGGPTLDAAPVEVTFAGEFSGLNVAQMAIDNSLATGGVVTPSTPTPGVRGTGRGSKRGDLLRDTVTPGLYQNAGTPEKPVWTAV